MLLRRIGQTIHQALVNSVPRATTHVLTQDAVVALTFDDGPHPIFTPALLEILEKHGARATFFMLGEAAVRHPEIVQQVARAGHAIGNHSWGHSSLPWLSGAQRRAELRRCSAVLGSVEHNLFRPPYGDQNIRAWLDARWLGYEIVTWNVDAKDWTSDGPDVIIERLLRCVTPGSIVLLHDNVVPSPHEGVDRTKAFRAVDQYLGLVGERMRFVTVPELFRRGRRQRRPWYQVIRREALGHQARTRQCEGPFVINQ